MADKCSAIARSGGRCGGSALAGRPFCFVHDPEAAAARIEASRKGGKARSNQARAKAAIPEALTDAELLGWLSLAFKRTIAGAMEPRIATAAASVASAILKARAATEIEERLAALEAEAGIDRAGRAA